MDTVTIIIRTITIGTTTIPTIGTDTIIIRIITIDTTIIPTIGIIIITIRIITIVIITIGATIIIENLQTPVRQ